MANDRWWRQLAWLAAVLAGDVAWVSAQPVAPARLSVATDGTQANGASTLLAISRDARQVLFSSAATNLVPGDTNGVADLFVRDRDTDRDGVLDEPEAVRTVRVTEGTGGQQSAAEATFRRLSPDGRFILFTTTAALVLEDTNAQSDAYLCDRDTDGDGMFDEPGATALTRVSTGSGGLQAEGASIALQMTADGRFVGFHSTAGNLHGQPTTVPQLYLKDRLTNATVIASARPDGSLAPFTHDPPTLAVSATGRYVAFPDVYAGGVLTWAVRDLEANTFVSLAAPAPQHLPFGSDVVTAPVTIAYAAAEPGFIGDRLYVTQGAWSTTTFVTNANVHEIDPTAGAVTRSFRGVARSPVRNVVQADEAVIFAGRIVDTLPCPQCADGLSRYDPRTRRITALTEDLALDPSSDASGRRLLYETVNLSSLARATVFLDTAYGVPLPMPADVRRGRLDATGMLAVFTAADDGVLAPGLDTNGVADVFAVDLASRLDRDGDGLDDRWEIAMGLDYGSGVGAAGAAGDPDGDGVDNAAEFAAGSHPRGTTRQFLAEGADNAFFKTRLAFANSNTTAATAVVRLDGDDGSSRFVNVHVPAGRRQTLFADEISGRSASFSTVVEADGALVVDRTMSWDASGYGGHAERATVAPSTSWFLAEGATGAFDLFYLLQNPGEVASTVTIRFLRPAPLPPIERTYSLPPHVRLTLPVQMQATELASADVSAAITSTQPILVERAMYRSVDGHPFAAGHASAGVTAPSLNWFLAEGATGPFFDLFILLANPNTLASAVEIRYLLAGGTVVAKTYVVPGQSRRTIYVDGEEFPGLGRVLANVSVSAAVAVTNGIPIVVERTMWFPGPEMSPAFWTEAHNSPGATATATRWALAEGEVGGSPGTQTFVLIANTSPTAGRVRITVLHEANTSPTAPTVIDLPAHSRTTVPMHTFLHDRRFGVLVESIDTTPLAALVVEQAMYWNSGGAIWAAGTNQLATPVP